MRHMLQRLCWFVLVCAGGYAANVNITTGSLPNGTVGTAYNQAIATSGGKRPFVFTISAGSLPDGLNIDAAQGTISGSPMTAGNFSFTVKVTDKDGSTDSQAYQVTINPAPLTITTGSLPGGTLGTAYSQTLTAAGGSGGYTWATTSGSLPAGLTLSAGGIISGTPTGATSNFTVTVTDSGKRTASKALSIAITVPPLSITTTSLPGGTVGTGYSQTLAATGGSGGNSWNG